jgi:DNA-binding NarL/FixJ family response regulator
LGNRIGVWLAAGPGPARERLLAALACHTDIDLLGHCDAAEPSLERRLAASNAQVLLIDWPAPRRGRGLAALRRYASLAPRVLVLVDEPTDGLAETVMRHRLRGFLLKNSSPQECQRAITRVHEGEIWVPRAMLAAAVTGLVDERAARLTVDAARDAARNRYTLRERQIVGLVRQGMTNKQIGLELGIAEDTVKKHLQNVYDKAGVRRRSLLALARFFSSSREAGWSS